MKNSAEDALKSQTAAGKCYLMAMALLRKLEADDSPTAHLAADGDLLNAWNRVKENKDYNQ